jgi:hypothetical protein
MIRQLNWSSKPSENGLRIQNNFRVNALLALPV